MLPVLLFLRVGPLRDDGTKRTKIIVNRRWPLPPTQITSPIHLSCSSVFAVVFIITYLTLLQKYLSNWLLLVKKMGSGQKAPTVPSDQGFYQSLWDDLDRSNRSLKRTAPSQANKTSATPPPTKTTPPPTKKAKTSSTLPILPETTSNRQLSP